MKGLVESRHTSSERGAPGVSSHPGAPRERVSVSSVVEWTHTIKSGQLTYLVMHLFELTASSSSDRIGARHHSEDDHRGMIT